MAWMEKKGNIHADFVGENERKRSFGRTSCRWVYLFTPWSIVLLEKLTVCQLVKQFPEFYRTQKFIATLKIAR